MSAKPKALSSATVGSAALGAVEAAARHHPSLRAHIVCSDRDGLLTADRVLGSVAVGASPWIYMCGPPPMMRALTRGFRHRGIPPARLRWEQFAGR